MMHQRKGETPTMWRSSPWDKTRAIEISFGSGPLPPFFLWNVFATWEKWIWGKTDLSTIPNMAPTTKTTGFSIRIELLW